jgi:hypothetical protein
MAEIEGIDLSNQEDRVRVRGWLRLAVERGREVVRWVESLGEAAFIIQGRGGAGRSMWAVRMTAEAE